MSKTPDSRGFTLVELLAVLAVISVLLTMSLGGMRSALSSWRISAATTDLTTSILATRARAVIGGARTVMPIDVNRGVYTVYDESAPGSATRTSDGGWLASLPTGVRFVRPDSGAVVTCARPDNPSDPAVAFEPSGLLYSVTRPGALYIGNPQYQLYRRVRVTLAGGVTVDTWNGSGWQ